MAWTLDVRSSLLRPLATIARPAMAWAHDRIVERGLAQFEARSGALEAVSSRDARSGRADGRQPAAQPRAVGHPLGREADALDVAP